MSDNYQRYCVALSEIKEIERVLNEKRRSKNSIEESLKESDTKGMVALYVTDHAFTQASKRIEEIAVQNQRVYDYVYASSVDDAMLVPANLNLFIIECIVKAYVSKDVISRQSKSGGVEYEYVCKMDGWIDSGKQIYFVSIVEKNSVKTCYFRSI